MIAKSSKKSTGMKVLAGCLVLVGLCWIGFLIWLAFHNWHAAVFICVLQIALNTGKTANNVQQLAKRRYF